ncbi:histidine protein methyltransferase 1 homolog [Malaya genurostris]|uniref:histidine protein methyltransferase 1 homolog n=1 Tax=Malaya genurostris TaxID=325434 RepID=UPI0026F40288|nr:histidine protein methyltransferase 1 homolog [Malaya genurostris]XP_058447873.1 histidine protein methyltransferase 1 homolog [Malaya genurostris]
MFKFSFNNDTVTSTSDSKDKTESDPKHECMELTLLEDCVRPEREKFYVFVASVDLQVEYLNCLTLPQEDLSSEILTAEQDHSDLIPGQYEGGLKVWECTFDLGELIAEREEYKKLFQSATVLDLGCGSGILGILAVKLGAAAVVFQDYNKVVLDAITMKNYFFNCCEEDETKSLPSTQARFFSGDWASFMDHVQEKFDVILTSETIYNQQHYSTLINLFKSKLKPDGVVLLAAKIYYFGVGGGLRLFESILEQDGTFSYRTASDIDDGVRREILEIRWKSPAVQDPIEEK